VAESSGLIALLNIILKYNLRLNPSLKKGDIGGFALDRFEKIPPTPLCKGGKNIYGQVLNIQR
jgi:hypothetical protein